VTSGGQRPIFFFAKTDVWSDRAAHVVADVLGGDVMSFRGQFGDAFPDLPDVAPRLILSFLSPWILPQQLLDRAGLALNFHPGSCDYPGIGCYNFALYERASHYGPVCHHMAARVDTGAVVSERLFATRPDDTVETLKLRTMETMIELIGEVVRQIASGGALPVSPRQWTRRPFRRAELDELGRVACDMPTDEVQRRVRAMEYPGYPGAFIELGGHRFYAMTEKRQALA
jgi:methionyl-tRNA formyltransferase